jgi:hypothetical protein
VVIFTPTEKKDLLDMISMVQATLIKTATEHADRPIASALSDFALRAANLKTKIGRL